VPPAFPPLELGCYGEEAVHARERAGMLHPGVGPVFLGSEATLGEGGHRRADGDDRILLTRSDGGEVQAFANLCTHALRPLVAHGDTVDSPCITCPYHQWSFRRDGTLIGGRDITFGVDDPSTGHALVPSREQLSLHRFDVLRWRGLVWSGARQELADLEADLGDMVDAFDARGLAGWLDLGSFTAAHAEDEDCRGDWKTFLEVYGDCYHVPAYHAGLASYADCRTLDWAFGRSWHAQFVQLSARAGGSSRRYRDWVDGLGAYYASRGEPVPELAVAWTAVYPNLMLELYNGMRVLSTIVPTGPASYRNRVQYLFPDDMEARVPGLVATIKAAYDETAVEDRRLNESRHDGLVTARSLGLAPRPYVANLSGVAPEAGTAHFHGWWRRRQAETAPA
jgi:choline monooxygenase